MRGGGGEYDKYTIVEDENAISNYIYHDSGKKTNTTLVYTDVVKSFSETINVVIPLKYSSSFKYKDTLSVHYIPDKAHTLYIYKTDIIQINIRIQHNPQNNNYQIVQIIITQDTTAANDKNSTRKDNDLTHFSLYTPKLKKHFLYNMLTA
jgi:hypothetical protein